VKQGKSLNMNTPSLHIMTQIDEQNTPPWIYIPIIIGGLIIFLESGLFPALLSIAGTSIATRNCYRLSKKINANKLIAIWIGIIFGLVGLLGYWIYYKNKG
jgi:Gpi18-like mannosyltransferase